MRHLTDSVPVFLRLAIVLFLYALMHSRGVPEVHGAPEPGGQTLGTTTCQSSQMLQSKGPVRMLMAAFFDIFDLAFDVLKESTFIDERSTDLDLRFGHLEEFELMVAPGESVNKVVHFRSVQVLFRDQFCHALLSSP